MDHEAPVLKVAPAPGMRLLAHAVAPGQGRNGAAAELIQLTAPAGSSVQLIYELPRAPVIAEVRLEAWAACNRPGVQLAAAVSLPRSIDPDTGRPRRLLLRSEKPAAAGDWQLLTIDDLQSRLDDQTRIARSQFGSAIDAREAYVSQLVILAPGGQGATEVLVEQVALYGVVGALGPRAEQVAAVAMPRAAATTGRALVAAEVRPAAAATPIARTLRPPAMPRILQWQGEPLELVRSLGFDAVWMGRPPTSAEAADAQAQGLFMVCPPPRPEEMATRTLGPEADGVIAWDLGQLGDAGNVAEIHRWRQAIERSESMPGRPVLLRPLGMTREVSRLADTLLLGRPMLGSSQSWKEYAAWLDHERRLARFGTPIWAAIETQSGNRSMAQLAALRGAPEAPATPATFPWLTRATTAAFSVMPRGFVFQSNTSLAADGVENRMRALALELTNLRLGLADPWLAAGKTPAAAASNRSDLTGMVLRVERSHLIVPLRWSDAAPQAPSTGGEPLAFVLPGAPESSEAYLVSLSGSERLTASRVTGGLRIALEHLPDDAFLLVTEDGYAYSHVERYLRAHAPRAAKVRIELAALRRQQAARAAAALPADALSASGAADLLARVDAELTAVVGTMRTGDFAGAFVRAADAERMLDGALERLAATVASNLPPGVSPIPIDWATLNDLAATSRTVAAARAAPQLISGGDFESLDAVVGSGWQRLETPPEGVTAEVRLSPEAPARGSYSLELDVRSQSPGGAPPCVPRAPVWVTSPPLAIDGARLVEISGVARVAEAPIGSPDPLLVFDSIGGEESAVRIDAAPSWTPFRLVRAVPAGAELRITIALGGVGRAHVDALAYRVIR
jgi:hypothetical protein